MASSARSFQSQHAFSITHHNRCSQEKGMSVLKKISVNLFFVLAMSAILRPAVANQIECDFDVNDHRQTLVLDPGNDVFASTKIDLPGGFRFAGQYLSNLNLFKAYIYHTPKERYILLALQAFSIAQTSCPQDFGQHRIYDSEDERELYFHCRKKCTQ